MAGEQRSDGLGWTDLMRADPAHVADAMVVSTENVLSFGDALRVHDQGFSAVTIAYERVVVNAVHLARQLDLAEGTAPEPGAPSWAETSLRLRATVDVAGRLAVDMAGRDGNRTPPRWTEMLDQILTREDPGSDESEPIGRAGQLVRSRVHMNVTLHPRREPTEPVVAATTEES